MELFIKALFMFLYIPDPFCLIDRVLFRKTANPLRSGLTSGDELYEYIYEIHNNKLLNNKALMKSRNAKPFSI